MTSATESLRILCVDDEPAMLDVYRRVLAPEDDAASHAHTEIQELEAQLFGESTSHTPRRSFEFVACRQGDEAVEAVRRAVADGAPFPVVFLDVRMPPGPDGVETAQRIRELDEHVELVLVTAYSDTDPQEIVERVPCPSGGLYYLQKPVHRFEVWQLAAALSKTWDSRRQVRDTNALLAHTNDMLRQDIVKRARMERDLDAKKRELEGLFYTLSHDLCAPVVSISGFASLIAQHCASRFDDDGRQYMERLQANLDVLTTMLRGARGLSEALRDAGPRASLSATEAVTEATRRLAELIDQTGAQITVAADLPQVVYPKEGLVHVFSHLIENAIRFTRDDATPQINIEHERQGSCDRFIVRDNGVGFPPTFRQRVFDAFVRLQPDKATGAGIGLTVVRRIVEDNGGQVGADTAPGEGSTFWFTVPRESSADSVSLQTAASAA